MKSADTEKPIIGPRLVACNHARRSPVSELPGGHACCHSHENGVQSVRPEPFGKLRTGLSRGRSWFDKLTTNGIRDVNRGKNSHFHPWWCRLPAASTIARSVSNESIRKGQCLNGGEILPRLARNSFLIHGTIAKRAAEVSKWAADRGCQGTDRQYCRPGLVYTSRFRTWRACAWMKAFRGGTSSPISVWTISWACTVSSTRTWSITRFSGSIVVSHSC